MATRVNNPAVQHFNKTSPFSPLSGGRMFFFEPGGSTTLKDTFKDKDENIANENPVILDASGFEPDIFGVGSYRVVLESSVTTNSIQQWERDSVDFSQDEGAFGDWLSTIDYGVGGANIVTGSDLNYYVSIQTPNINKDPISSPTFWTEFDLLKEWNTNETYFIGDPVSFGNSFYTSLTNSNVGNQPDTNPSDWDEAVGGSVVTNQTFTASGTWNRPANVRYIIVEVIGGGGGGGSTGGGSDDTGGGGGGGGYARAVIDVTALASETVTVGTGGAGATGIDTNGAAGVTTSFGSLCVATGGLDGGGSSDIAPPYDFGALGGIGTTGDFLSSGGAGEPSNTSSLIYGAAGGSSALGAGGSSRVTEGTGDAGRNYGGGGAGGYLVSGTTQDGGNGADGIVIVTEYR